MLITLYNIEYMKKFFLNYVERGLFQKFSNWNQQRPCWSLDAGSVMKAAKWHCKSATTAVLSSGSSRCSYHKKAAIRTDRRVMCTNHQADVLELSSVKMW